MLKFSLSYNTCLSLVLGSSLANRNRANIRDPLLMCWWGLDRCHVWQRPRRFPKHAVTRLSPMLKCKLARTRNARCTVTYEHISWQQRRSWRVQVCPQVTHFTHWYVEQSWLVLAIWETAPLCCVASTSLCGTLTASSWRHVYSERWWESKRRRSL